MDMGFRALEALALEPRESYPSAQVLDQA